MCSSSCRVFNVFPEQCFLAALSIKGFDAQMSWMFHGIACNQRNCNQIMFYKSETNYFYLT